MGGLTALLAVAAIGLLGWNLYTRWRIQNLAARIEDFLSVRGEPLRYSVREDGLAPLHNAAAELEQRLLLAQEQLAEEARRVSGLTADISHQLKTPLTSLRLFCELDDGPHAAQEMEQLDRMDGLIEALLRLERLCADGYAFDLREQSVAVVVRRAWEDVAAAYPGRPMTLTGDARLRCDAAWLGEAFRNLFKNACVHTPEGGPIRANIETIGAMLFIAVEDEGGGVSPRDLPRLFDRFYRAEGASQQGTGLGLAIAREIIRRHHGDIRAENTGKGLRLRVALPMTRQTEKAAPGFGAASHHSSDRKKVPA